MNPRVALLCAGLLSATALAAEPTAYERYVEASLQSWGAPGVAVAIVRGGKVQLLRGFGVRTLGKPEAVDARTVFPLASLTKGFTAAAVAALVEDGKLSWDDPVERHLPGFRVEDPQVSHALTLRDLAAHRTGLAEGADNLWIGTRLTPAQIIERLAFLPQASPIRTGYAYQNVTYLVLGQSAAQAAGTSWETLVTQRLLKPLGMKDASVTGRGTNVASSHPEREGKLLPSRPEPVTQIAPAAGLRASATDLAQWLKLFLGQGEVDGKRVLQAASVEELLAPQMLVPFGPRYRQQFPDTHYMAYGLGWVSQDYRGKKVVWNTGGLDGVTCSVALIPEANFGVVVLTNQGRTGFPEALVWRAVDEALGAPEKDWSSLRLKISLEAREREAQRVSAADRSRKPGTRPSLPTQDYLGTYRQDLLGTLELVPQGDTFAARLNGWQGVAEHWHHDTFRITWDRPELGKSLLTFTLEPGGLRPESLSVEDAGVFTRTEKRDR